MSKTHGYAIKGKRCYGKHDWSAKGRTNVIGSLAESTLVAIGLITGSVNKDFFTAQVEQILLPNIAEKSIFVMDNAAFYKGKDMQQLLHDI